MKDTVLLALAGLLVLATVTALGYLVVYLQAKAAALKTATNATKAQQLYALGLNFFADGVQVAADTIRADTANGVSKTTLPTLATDLAAKFKTFIGTEGLKTLETGLGLVAGIGSDFLVHTATTKLTVATSPKQA